MKAKVETINVSIFLSDRGEPYGDVVVFRTGGYYRRYSFTPCLRCARSISAASMVRAQRQQRVLMGLLESATQDGGRFPRFAIGNNHE